MLRIKASGRAAGWAAVLAAWAFVALGGPGSGLSSAEEAAAPADEAHRWVAEARELIVQLQDLADSQPSSSLRSPWEESRVHLAKTDATLWKLWLKTGMPPRSEALSSDLHKAWEENVAAYQQFVDKNSARSEEDIQRQGLRDAIAAFRSPMGYMAWQYFIKKTGVETDFQIFIHVTPSRFMIEVPPNDPLYQKISTACSRWLDANEDRLAWNPKRNRFDAREGGFVEVEALKAALQTSADEAMKDE